MSQEPKLITKAQIRKIWVEAKGLGFEKEIIYETIYNHFNKEHLSDLTKEEASILIDGLVKASKEYQTDRAQGMMTEKQEWKIEDYRIKLGWSRKQLKAFIKKFAHIDHINWLTVNQASNIIEGLKNIYLRNNEENLVNSRGK